MKKEILIVINNRLHGICGEIEVKYLKDILSYQYPSAVIRYIEYTDKDYKQWIKGSPAI